MNPNVRLQVYAGLVAVCVAAVTGTLVSAKTACLYPQTDGTGSFVPGVWYEIITHPNTNRVVARPHNLWAPLTNGAQEIVSHKEDVTTLPDGTLFTFITPQGACTPPQVRIIKRGGE